MQGGAACLLLSVSLYMQGQCLRCVPQLILQPACFRCLGTGVQRLGAPCLPQKQPRTSLTVVSLLACFCLPFAIIAQIGAMCGDGDS